MGTDGDNGLVSISTGLLGSRNGGDISIVDGSGNTSGGSFAVVGSLSLPETKEEKCHSHRGLLLLVMEAINLSWLANRALVQAEHWR